MGRCWGSIHRSPPIRGLDQPCAPGQDKDEPEPPGGGWQGGRYVPVLGGRRRPQLLTLCRCLKQQRWPSFCPRSPWKFASWWGRLTPGQDTCHAAMGQGCWGGRRAGMGSAAGGRSPPWPLGQPPVWVQPATSSRPACPGRRVDGGSRQSSCFQHQQFPTWQCQ